MRVDMFFAGCSVALGSAITHSICSHIRAQGTVWTLLLLALAALGILAAFTSFFK